MSNQGWSGPQNDETQGVPTQHAAGGYGEESRPQGWSQPPSDSGHRAGASPVGGSGARRHDGLPGTAPTAGPTSGPQRIDAPGQVPYVDTSPGSYPGAQPSSYGTPGWHESGQPGYGQPAPSYGQSGGYGQAEPYAQAGAYGRNADQAYPHGAGGNAAWAADAPGATGYSPYPQQGAHNGYTYGAQAYPTGGQMHPPAMYAAPHGGIDPMTGEPLSDKSKVVAGLLQFFLGVFGAGRFYIGDAKTGGIQLGLFLVGCLTLILLFGIAIIWGVAIWAFIDAIIMWAGGARDQYGRKLS